MKTVGEIGEQVVQQWLIQKKWQILQHRWRCRLGEIDLIALPQSFNSLTFIEVKTRSSNNWDENGLLAITSQKKIKLTQAATFFIAKYPKYSDYNCRFDVALVKYKKNNSRLDVNDESSLIWRDYYFQIQDYIENAFEEKF